jgi:hypothetical protein
MFHLKNLESQDVAPDSGNEKLKDLTERELYPKQ